MSWIKENPFLAGVAAVTAVATVGLGYFISSQSSRYNAALEDFSASSSKISEYNRMKLYPSAANQTKKKSAVEAYEEGIKEVETAVKTFMPETLADVPSDQFTGLLSQSTNDVREKLESAGVTVPERFLLGFKSFASDTPDQSATGELTAQLNSLKWLTEQLAEAKISKLVNLRREKIDAEEKKPDKAKSNKKKRRDAAEEQSFVTPQEVQLTFTGSEESLRSFLTAITESKEHIFGIRRMRIQNEKLTAPTQKDANFPEENLEEEDNDFGADDGGFILEEDGAVGDGADAPASQAGQRILAQVIGSEQVHVFLQLELMSFPPATEVAAAE